MRLGCTKDVGVRRLDDLVVYQLSVEFKRAVYQLVRHNPVAAKDLRYRDQLFDAALSASANIAEGFGRRTTADFCQFLAYARGSISECIIRLQDGVDRGHFTAPQVEAALTFGRRTAAAIAGLQRSLRPFLVSNQRPGARRIARNQADIP
jgi:four helix bundle protein